MGFGGQKNSFNGFAWPTLKYFDRSRPPFTGLAAAVNYLSYLNQLGSSLIVEFTLWYTSLHRTLPLRFFLWIRGHFWLVVVSFIGNRLWSVDRYVFEDLFNPFVHLCRAGYQLVLSYRYGRAYHSRYLTAPIFWAKLVPSSNVTWSDSDRRSVFNPAMIIGTVDFSRI